MFAKQLQEILLAPEQQLRDTVELDGHVIRVLRDGDRVVLEFPSQEAERAFFRLIPDGQVRLGGVLVSYHPLRLAFRRSALFWALEDLEADV